MKLVLKSDVSNDLRQCADQIGSVGKAIAEFVWNSIDYQPDGEVAEVDILITRNRTGGVESITIKDRGRGMDLRGLQDFFTMHGPNRDRLEGRPGRNKFGTGAKAAAMAIAETLEVDTVKEGVRTIATLHRAALLPGRSEVPVPFERQSVDREHGTRITLRDLRLRRFKEDAARSYVQKALGRNLHKHSVRWNGERLTYEEPAYEREWRREAPEELIPLLGEVSLTVRLSQRWLETDERGITITSVDAPHELGYLGDNSASPFAGRIYGFIEVAMLEEEDDEGRPAYTADRTLTLNRENTRVQALLSWMNREIVQIINTLEAEDRARQDQVRQERLMRTAKTIEEALNRRLQRAFENLERRLTLRASPNPDLVGVNVDDSAAVITADISAGGNGYQTLRDDPKGDVPWREPADGETPTVYVSTVNGHGGGGGGGGGRGTQNLNAILDQNGNRRATVRGARDGASRRPQPKGSFRVMPKAMGADGPRAYYATTQMTIYVNTDHPQFGAAGSEETPSFKILMAEAAASEFALAVTAMRIEYNDPEVDPSQWQTILTAVRREESETGVELAGAIAGYTKVA